MTWQVVTLDRKNDEQRIDEKVQTAFEKLFIVAGAPPAAIMYGVSRELGNELRLYFNPPAVSLAAPLLAAYGAIDCPAPDISSLLILVNNRGSGIARW